MSRINVDFIAIADVEGQFAQLAELLGLVDADHARGKMEHIWMACTVGGTEEVPMRLVVKHLGDNGPSALITTQLAKWGRGRGDSDTRMMCIAGAKKRCLWLAQRQGQSSKGGKKRAETAQRSAGGRYQPTPQDSTSPPAPAPAPAPRSEEPASASPGRAEEKPKARKEPTGDHARAVSEFHDRFKAKYGVEYDWRDRDFAAMARLRKNLGLDQLIARIGVLFESPPPFLARSPPDVPTLEQHVNKLAAPSLPFSDSRSQPGQHAIRKTNLL